MAPRPAWKGYLKLSLVTCAVEVTNATTQADKISFRVLNRETGNTVKRRYVEAESGKPLADKDEVKGYETADDEFLLIEEEEIDAVQIESSHTLNLEGFVDKSEIEQVYLDTPYYLTPADKVSVEAFGVIRDALAGQKMAGLARIVLYRRERPVLIEPMGQGMLMTTLRYDSTVRKADDVFADLEGEKLDDEMIDLATHVIERKSAKFDPSEFEDRYETALHKLVEAKKAGHKPPKTAKAAKKPSNVVNLFDALKKSLADGGGDDGAPKTKPGKKTPAKPARGGGRSNKSA